MQKAARLHERRVPAAVWEKTLGFLPWLYTFQYRRVCQAWAALNPSFEVLDTFLERPGVWTFGSVLNVRTLVMDMGMEILPVLRRLTRLKSCVILRTGYSEQFSAAMLAQLRGRADVDFDVVYLSDTLSKALLDLPRLTSLNLPRRLWSDADFVMIGDLPCLRELTLDEGSFHKLSTPAKFPCLRLLVLINCALTGSSARAFGSLAQLRHLTCVGSRVPWSDLVATPTLEALSVDSMMMSDLGMFLALKHLSLGVVSRHDMLGIDPDLAARLETLVLSLEGPGRQRWFPSAMAMFPNLRVLALNLSAESARWALQNMHWDLHPAPGLRDLYVPRDVELAQFHHQDQLTSLTVGEVVDPAWLVSTLVWFPNLCDLTLPADTPLKPFKNLKLDVYRQVAPLTRCAQIMGLE